MIKLLFAFINRQLRGILGNYKTTLGGVAMIAHGLWLLIDLTYAVSEGRSEITPDTAAVLEQAVQIEIMGGFALLFAKDATKTGA